MINRKITFYLLLFIAYFTLSSCVAVNRTTLSELQLKWFLKYEKMPTAKAFAVGPLDSLGWGYGYDSVAEAEERALKECDKRNRAKNSCVLYESQERIAIKAHHRKIVQTQ